MFVCEVWQEREEAVETCHLSDFGTRLSRLQATESRPAADAAAVQAT